MANTMHTIQLEQALFEVHNGVVGKRRAIDRLVAAIIVGAPVAVAGPPGVGKSHLIKSVSRVFGLEVVGLPAESNPTAPLDPNLLYAADVDLLDADRQSHLVDMLCGSATANVIITTASERPATLWPRLRDELMGFVQIPYPSASDEIALAVDANRPHTIDRILHSGDLTAMRIEAERLPIPDSVVAYAVRLVQATRSPEMFGLACLSPLLSGGASPRASIGLVRASRGMALIAGRQEVTVQDVYDAAFEALVHRVQLSVRAQELGVGAPDVVVEVLGRVPADGPT